MSINILLITTYLALSKLPTPPPAASNPKPISKLCTPAPEPPSNLEILTSWLNGSFSSQQQAAVDMNYYDIRLEMAPIWAIEL